MNSPSACPCTVGDPYPDKYVAWTTAGTGRHIPATVLAVLPPRLHKGPLSSKQRAFRKRSITRGKMTDDGPFIRAEAGGIHGRRDEQEITIANDLIQAVLGYQLAKFRLDYGVHLELGNDFEITIETEFTLEAGEIRWTGEPLTTEAGKVLLPLTSTTVSEATIGNDGTLRLALGQATLTVSPHPLYEAWQFRGPRDLLIVCSPGGDYVAYWAPILDP